MRQSQVKSEGTRRGDRNVSVVLTTKLCKHLWVRNHMLQAKVMLLCDFVEIQKPRLRQSLFQKLLTGLAGGVGHVPARVHEDRVLGDVWRVHEKRRDILRGKRASRGKNIEE